MGLMPSIPTVFARQALEKRWHRNFHRIIMALLEFTRE